MPIAERDDLLRELERVSAVTGFLTAAATWGPPPVPDARAALGRLAVEGAVLEPEELHRVGVLLRSARTLAEALRGKDVAERSGDPADADVASTHLGRLRARLFSSQEVEERIERTVDPDGSVLDTASRELGRLRERLRRAHGRIVERLERYVRSLPDRIVVADASVSIREGRYVIPIRREGKGEVGGIVHDESATGATLFVEPPVGIELMNELKEMERAEAREIQRILREISRVLASNGDALRGSLEALVDFDSLHARARTGMQWAGEVPELLEPGSGRFTVVGGRHPLLVEGEEEAVPFDLELEADERAIVVSGPNTGGKSVFLKSVGLIVALTQAGCVPPTRAGTRLPVFGDLFADIGDEQSIAESLSTFSAHLQNLRELVEGADGSSLVLIDEMGTGTDPAEGAALARAILEELVETGARVFVTSHLGALKTLDTEGSGIVNASLHFDPDRMEPTYRFVKGRPGRSYGLAIARRLGFPGRILDRAEAHLSEGEASVEDLLEKLERKEREADELVSELRREREEAEELRRSAEAREAELREREREAERKASEEARQLLMEAREEVESAIREVREHADDDALAETARRARRRVEEAAREQRERARSRREADRAAAEAPQLEPGDRVRLVDGNRAGRVKGIEDGRVTVEMGGLAVEVPAADLVRLPPESGTKAKAPGQDRAAERKAGESGGGWRGSVPEGRHEVDLRGLRVDEVELELGRALDAASLSGLTEVRVIHGKGTGALRSRVRELLGREERVADFRPGRPGEGGGGVTVAKVKT